MLNPLRVLGSAVVLLLCLSAYQTYQNAADCRFYGMNYSWFRGSCVASRASKRKAAHAVELGRSSRADGPVVDQRSRSL